MSPYESRTLPSRHSSTCVPPCRTMDPTPFRAVAVLHSGAFPVISVMRLLIVDIYGALDHSQASLVEAPPLGGPSTRCETKEVPLMASDGPRKSINLDVRSN